MKKVLVLLSVLLLFSVAFGWTGWFSDYVLIGGEVAPDNYYWVGSDPSYGTEFNGHDFGSVTSLIIKGCDFKYWSDTQDRAGGAFYWRINTGTATEVIWVQSGPNGNDYQGLLSGQSIDVCNGLSAGQTYELQIWAKSWDGGGGQGDSWLNNGGANYVATFTIPEEEVPVTLASFTAAAVKGSVKLNWVTESEAENSHFLIYRDGEVIAQVEGAGTTSETNSYSYLDTRVQAGNHRYAISDVTYGGVEKVHEAVTVEVGAALAEASFELSKAYPNPFNPSTNIRYALPTEQDIDLGVYDMNGLRVADLYSGSQSAGEHSLVWNASGFPSGIYFVRLFVGDMVQTMKVVLMK